MPTSASVRLFSTVSDSKCGSPFIQPIVLGRWWRAQHSGPPALIRTGFASLFGTLWGTRPSWIIYAWSILNAQSYTHITIYSSRCIDYHLRILWKCPRASQETYIPCFWLSLNCWEDSDQILWKVIYDLVYNLSSSNCKKCTLLRLCFFEECTDDDIVVWM